MTISELSVHFQVAFGHRPEFVVQAPGRINIIGEHTDYNDGFVLPAAVNKHMLFAFRPREDGLMRITALDLKETVDFHQGKAIGHDGSWSRFLEGLYLEFVRAGQSPPGFECVFSSTIPIGAGMSSSSALECGLSAGMNRLIGYRFTALELVELSRRSNHQYLGLKGGIMDQFTCFYGQRDKAVLLDCRDLSYQYTTAAIEGHSWVLFNTMIRHELIDSPYNDKVRACSDFISAVQAIRPGVRTLRDLDVDLLSLSGMQNLPGFEEARFVVHENERTTKAFTALKQNDPDTLGNLLYLSHEGLSKVYKVSCKELDFLVATSKNVIGVKGSRMMGGGFGGCTINLCETDQLESVRKEITDAFRAEFGHSPEFYPVEIADGLMISTV